MKHDQSLRLCAIPHENLPTYVTCLSRHPTLENALRWAHMSGLMNYPTGRMWIDRADAPAVLRRLP